MLLPLNFPSIYFFQPLICFEAVITSVSQCNFMKLIAQLNPYGCGVACVASILGVSYAEALRFFQRPRQAGTRGYYCREVVEALKKGGRNYSYNYLTKKKLFLLKTSRIVIFLRKSKKYPAGHYLTKGNNGKWMDPWINFPEMPSKSGRRSRLPGKPNYIIYPTRSDL